MIGRVESKGFTVLEAAVGFAVVLDPRNSALVSTVGSPGVVFQRLSKEEVKIADGPLRLLETMSVVSYFRKTITRKYCVFYSSCHPFLKSSLSHHSSLCTFSTCVGRMYLRTSPHVKHNHQGHYSWHFSEPQASSAICINGAWEFACIIGCGERWRMEAWNATHLRTH